MEKAIEVNNITYRLFEEKDREGVIRLWEEASDWGGINLLQFKKWFTNTPYGDCLIIIAKDDNDLIGQLIFTPSLLNVKGSEIKTLRVAAPILRKEFRFSGNDFQDHPICKMFSYGISIAQKRGFALAYIFPAKGWLRAIKFISNSNIYWQTYVYDSFSISLNSSGTEYIAKDETINFNLSPGFTDEYNQLWNDAKTALPIDCGIVRKKEWLQYRLSAHLTIEARNKITGKLLGYCTLKKKSGLLVDMLARNKNEIESILKGTVGMLHHSNPNRTPVEFDKITGMLTPLISDIATSLHPKILDYKFDFGCCVLNKAINFEHVKPTEWYMMPDV